MKCHSKIASEPSVCARMLPTQCTTMFLPFVRLHKLNSGRLHLWDFSGQERAHAKLISSHIFSRRDRCNSLLAGLPCEFWKRCKTCLLKIQTCPHQPSFPWAVLACHLKYKQQSTEQFQQHSSSSPVFPSEHLHISPLSHGKVPFCPQYQVL